MPSDCAPNFLYVVFDPKRVASKIGMSKKPVRRYATYRKQVGPHIELVHFRPSGCEVVTARREQAAHRKMERVFERLNGDWFDAAHEDAVAILDQVVAQ